MNSDLSSMVLSNSWTSWSLPMKGSLWRFFTALKDFQRVGLRLTAYSFQRRRPWLRMGFFDIEMFNKVFGSFWKSWDLIEGVFNYLISTSFSIFLRFANTFRKWRRRNTWLKIPWQCSPYLTSNWSRMILKASIGSIWMFSRGNFLNSDPRWQKNDFVKCWQRREFTSDVSIGDELLCFLVIDFVISSFQVLFKKFERGFFECF